mmetsp:Transcript_995/g.2777  ORF Transcript_995/g.2777 Transcript_995/m.2777 type:complete len:84 (+) Transcript_995:271-522(+)
MATTAAMTGVTVYSLRQKPKNGLALLLAGGAAGSLVDMVYGWNVACASQVEQFYVRREQDYFQRLEEQRRKQDEQQRQYDETK